MDALRNTVARRSLLAVVMFAVVASACVNTGGGDDPSPTAAGVEPIVAQEPTEPTTIRFSVFSSVAEAPQMKAFKEEFERLYPNITVDYEPVASGRAREKLLTEIAGGNAPDVHSFPTRRSSDLKSVV